MAELSRVRERTLVMRRM